MTGCLLIGRSFGIGGRFGIYIALGFCICSSLGICGCFCVRGGLGISCRSISCRLGISGRLGIGCGFGVGIACGLSGSSGFGISRDLGIGSCFGIRGSFGIGSRLGSSSFLGCSSSFCIGGGLGVRGSFGIGGGLGISRRLGFSGLLLVCTGTGLKIGLGLARNGRQLGSQIGIELGILGKMLGDLEALAQFVRRKLTRGALVSQQLFDGLWNGSGRCRHRGLGRGRSRCCLCRSRCGLGRSGCGLSHFCWRFRRGSSGGGLWWLNSRLHGGSGSFWWLNSRLRGGRGAARLGTQLKFSADGLSLSFRLGLHFGWQIWVSHGLAQGMEMRLQLFRRKLLHRALVLQNLQQFLRYGRSSCIVGLGKAGSGKDDRWGHEQCQANKACCEIQFHSRFPSD